MSFEIKSENNSVQMTVTLPKETKAAVKKLAAERAVRVSDLVEQMISHCLKNVVAPTPS